MEDCQHILKALGAFDYVAATKLISKITKVTLFFFWCLCMSFFLKLSSSPRLDLPTNR